MTVLNKKDYARFERLIEDGLKHPVGLVPTPRLNHVDIIKRIHDEAINAGMPPDIAAGIGHEWRDFDRRNGNRCFEAIFSVKAAVRFVKKLFGKGETK